MSGNAAALASLAEFLEHGWVRHARVRALPRALLVFGGPPDVPSRMLLTLTVSPVALAQLQVHNIELQADAPHAGRR